jgi:hypothetical protein
MAQGADAPQGAMPGTGGPPGTRIAIGGRGSRGLPFIAAQMLSEGDRDRDKQLSKEEFRALADAWFEKLDSGGTGKLTQEELTSRLGELFHASAGARAPSGIPSGAGRGSERSSTAVSPDVLGPILFNATDADKNGTLTRVEFKQAFDKWFDTWDTEKAGKVTEDNLRKGLEIALPRPGFGPRAGELNTRSSEAAPNGNAATTAAGADTSGSARLPGRDRAVARTNSPPELKGSYESFKLIAERNIFNPNRRARRPGGSDEEARPKQTDTISLVGTLVSEKGSHAFFDSNSAEYTKVLESGKPLVGYEIKEITGSGIKLQSGTNSLEMRVGMKLRREEGGEWQLARGNAPELSSNAASSSSPAESPGDESDIIKRLMQQREQELK